MQNNDNKKLDPKNDQKEKELKELIEKMTKELPFTGISVELEKEVRKVSTELHDLKEEIITKKEDFEKQSGMLKDRLDVLVKTGKLKIDEAEFARSQQSFEYYKKVLDSIGDEVESELYFCFGLISDNPPKTLRVAKNKSDDVNDYIKSKVDWLKKYVKKVRKDLRVGYSKYDFGLQSQLRNLDYLEAYLKRMEKK